jgi:LmbE family N-acetylglucosaminyl deacetylase
MDFKGKRVLIVSPHPDDEIISCGGLIQRCKTEGAEVFVFYIVVGKSRQLVTGSTSEDVRLKEAEDVARFCGFNYRFLFIGDKFVRLDGVNQKDLIDPIEDQIDAFKPDIVCIPYKDSYDQDHRAVFTACITALRPVPKKIRHMPSIVIEYEEPYLWSVSDTAFKPDFFVELTQDMVAGKLEAMRLHKTQNRDDPFPRSGENLKRWAEIRGKEIGVGAAEAFKCRRFMA